MRTSHKILHIASSRLISFSAAILFNVSLAALVCGTFAWYSYATRTGLEKQYHGTTVGDMGSLQAGLISDVRLPNYLEFDLAEDDRTLADENKLIYWCKERIEARTINYVLKQNGFATTHMNPVTSGSFDYSDNDFNSFSLYRRPGYLDNYSKDDPESYASKSSYSELNFVFRFEDIDNIGSYLPNYNVFLTGFDIKSEPTQQDIYKAVRVFFRNGYEGYLINPTSEEDGFNLVGGILDLNADGFYDYDEDGYEIIYGEVDEFHYNNEVTVSSENIDNKTTFDSNHMVGVYAIDENTLEPKKVKYTGIEKFLTKGRAITYTDYEYHNLGRFDMFIYFEGWDRHVIDREQGHGYNLDLKFEEQM